MKVNIYDGNLFLNRFARSTTPSHDLEPTNRFLDKIWEGRVHGSPIIVFDGRRPEFRLEILPEYKQRIVKKDKNKYIKQEEEALRLLKINITAMTKLLNLMGIPVVRHSEYEADDQAFRLVEHFSKFADVSVSTSDSDWFQMIKLGAKVVRPFHDEIVDRGSFKEKFGFPVEFYPLFLSITGTHNAVPGVPKVGPSRASQILKEINYPDFKVLKTWLKENENFSTSTWFDSLKSSLKIVKRNIPIVDLSQVPLTCSQMLVELEKSQGESEFNFKEFIKLARELKVKNPGRWVSVLGS